MLNQSITIQQDRILISGELTFATVEGILKQSQKIFPKQGQWNCDLSQVTTCDSAGIALLLEWLKWAGQRQIKLCFFQLPNQLQAIIAAAGLDKLFV